MRKVVIAKSKAVASSYDDFIDNEGPEASKLIKKFKELKPKMRDFGDAEWNIVMKRLNTYDKPVQSAIQHWVEGNGLPTVRALADLGIEIQNKYGTEMRMSVQALEDFITAANRALKIKH
jgi:hypothetical protein